MKNRKLILNFSLYATTNDILLIVEDQESFEYLKTFVNSRFKGRVWRSESMFGPFLKDAALTFFKIDQEDGELYLKYYKVLILFLYGTCKDLNQLYDELLPVTKPIAILNENFKFGSDDLISSVDFVFRVSQFSIRNQFTNEALEEWLELNKQKTFEKLPLDFEIIFDLLTKVDLDCHTYGGFCKNFDFTFDKKNECIYVHKKGVSPFEEEEVKPMNADQEMNPQSSFLRREKDTANKALKEIGAELDEIRAAVSKAEEFIRQMGITPLDLGLIHNGLQTYFNDVLFRCNRISRMLLVRANNAQDEYWDYKTEKGFEHQAQFKRRLREKMKGETCTSD